MIDRVPVSSASGPLVAQVELLNRSVSPEAGAHLLAGRGPAAKEFQKLYFTADKTPELVHQARVNIEKLS